MSSSNGPVGGACRLHLGEDFVWLERPGLPDERRACDAGTPGYLDALRELADLCEAPVTAVLPPEAFAVERLGRGRLARLRARRALARALGVGWNGVLVAAGRAGGLICLVGLSGSAMRDTVRFLQALGIRVAALEPDPGLLSGGGVPRFPVRERAGPDRTGPARAAGRRLAGVRWTLLPAGGAAAAVLAAALAVPGGGERQELGAERRLAEAAKVSPAVTNAEPKPAPAAAPPEVHAAAPTLRAPRPMDRPRLALLRSQAPEERAPAALAPATVDGPAAVMASRSVPPEVREAALAALRAAEEAGGAGTHARVAVLGPVARPTEPGGQADPVHAEVASGDLRPLPRPGGEAGGVADGPEALGAVTAAAADGRPRPRPGDGVDRLALAVEAAIAAVAPADQPASEGRAGAGAIRPEPRSFAGAAAAAGAGLRVTPPIQPAPVQPAPVQAATVQAKPVPPVQTARPVAPAVQQQPVRQPAPVQAASPGTGSVALIGVFGTSSRRHALVRLPNGSVQRVQPGDAVNGVQIAGVGEDSVRVRVNGRDGVLRLPD